MSTHAAPHAPLQTGWRPDPNGTVVRRHRTDRADPTGAAPHPAR